MHDAFNYPAHYRIEVSGWGLDGVFFVEKTDLLWSQDGGKYVQLHRALPEGTTVFLRLLRSDAVKTFLPVAYQVEGAQSMDCNGQCEFKLKQLYPRSKTPQMGEPASHIQEAAVKTERLRQLELEEVLQ